MLSFSRKNTEEWCSWVMWSFYFSAFPLLSLCVKVKENIFSNCISLSQPSLSFNSSKTFLGDPKIHFSILTSDICIIIYWFHLITWELAFLHKYFIYLHLSPSMQWTWKLNKARFLPPFHWCWGTCPRLYGVGIWIHVFWL